MNYEFLTDVCADMPHTFYEENNIKVLSMEFSFEEKSYKHYSDYSEMSSNEFYTKIINGAMPKTSQNTFLYYTESFEPILKEGKDIFYICFSSGLSGSYGQCLIAKKELEKKYPERKIAVVDSRLASAAQGCLVYYIVQKKNEQKDISLEDITAFAESLKTKIRGYLVVEDLFHLKRGGRISGITATFGKALQIRPLITIDTEGKLSNIGKIRGKNKVNETLIDIMKKEGKNLKNQTVFIAHSYSPESADLLKNDIENIVKSTFIAEVGPVIGSHVGIGLLAIIFVANT